MSIRSLPPLRPDTVVAPSSRPQRGEQAGIRRSLVALEAFVATTAVAGAAFVPRMPRELLAHGLVRPFTDYTVPALALGVVCGGSAGTACVAVLRKARCAPFAAIAAGFLMIGFELVEIATIGLTAAQSPSQPWAWLQEVYLAAGAFGVWLGLRLGRTPTNS